MLPEIVSRAGHIGLTEEDEPTASGCDPRPRQEARSGQDHLSVRRGTKVGGDDWRDLMDDARDLARDLARSGDVEISQKGEVLDPDATWRGPIRIRAT